MKKKSFWRKIVDLQSSWCKNSVNNTSVALHKGGNRPFSKMAAENSKKLKLAKTKNVYLH